MKSRTLHSGARGLGLRFGWPVWPGASRLEGCCSCGDAFCLYAGPHPLPIRGCDWSIDPQDGKRDAHAWSLWPDALPLLVAGGELDLVGAEVEDALAILDALDASGSLLRPVVIYREISVFIVAPHELRRWRQYADYGRGIRLLPWIPIPSETPNEEVCWQVPPTDTNSSPLPTFPELSPAFVQGLSKGRTP